jgi:hypothetical protein
VVSSWSAGVEGRREDEEGFLVCVRWKVAFERADGERSVVVLEREDAERGDWSVMVVVFKREDAERSSSFACEDCVGRGGSGRSRKAWLGVGTVCDVDECCGGDFVLGAAALGDRRSSRLFGLSRRCLWFAFDDLLWGCEDGDLLRLYCINGLLLLWLDALRRCNVQRWF